MLEANLALKHRDDRPVRLRLVYGGGDRTVEVDRAALQDSPFSYVESEGTAGILTVHGFFPPLVDRIRGNLLPRITPDSAPLILDLRLCHDGTLDEAVRFVNLFLKERRIGHLEGRGGAKTELSAMENPALADQRLAVWIGRATIGPAELAASALQRHRKALLIGGPTLGLAAQRDFFALEDGSGVVLTTAVFRPDGGEELWLKGLKPDVDVAPEGPDQAALLDATLKGMTKR